MPSPEIPLSLTPRQAADGAVVTIPLPNAATRIRVPPAEDGDLVRAHVDGHEVLLRIQVTGGGTPKGRPWPALLGVGAVIGFAVFLTTGLEGASTPADPSAGSSPYASYTQDPYGVETEEAYTEDPYAADPSTSEPDASEETEDTYTEDPYDTASEAPDPYESGTCLNGTLPDSTTAQEVSGVDEVSCSASDAHYQVIETIPLTSDMSRCDANSRTQYAFSYRYTLNGATLNAYVYCLIGLGSYAR
ncbi:LppU/SCO3897 family protein [Streptomyces atroolivaceus]|uniref:LppU/SCO3897 family protein n=1 Tax=Streptomyces atroolivaceus TaxID=66869 RepID=UPI0036C31730